MQERILDFISGLRRAEIRVSPSEAVDALLAAAEIGLDDREMFKSALAATLVKEARDRTTFDRLFNAYFLDGPGLSDGPQASQIFDRLRVPTADENVDRYVLASSLFRGEPAVGSQGEDNGCGYLMSFGRPGAVAADPVASLAVEQRPGRVLPMLEAEGIDPHEMDQVRSLELWLAAFRGMTGTRGRRAWRQGETLGQGKLGGKPLFELTPDEITHMKDVVARLARKIKDALAFRQRRKREGRLDARRTIRRSLQYGGVPMELVLRRRRRDRPKLITICDVSDSVRNASRFMLQLVWSLQECFSQVRSFVFVSEIAEVTHAFNTSPVERAIEWALKCAEVDYHCQSDFGHAFTRFIDGQLDRLDRHTTVLVLGDACNNFREPQEWALQLIRERVNGVIWLNPEPQSGWGLGDSVMPLYAHSCDLVRECQTVSQLGEAVEDLVQKWWRRRR